CANYDYVLYYFDYW
nr:immunoglobulin heavy chain junction region [Mus musculus]MBK4196793.1 immunoglobulin heavy chain junction region [Mus musculus]MBK4196794.1 immunoglobulin heavy chain junction region [Mus musculus]MBK4196795.1 immunoglobulin heavy chain junction region [Mus musculus]MBK4196796.1 immunoglobulin heavy chain junction region [Mus musculus]